MLFINFSSQFFAIIYFPSAASRESAMLREYFKCKECFVNVWEKRIAKHHNQAHPRVPHETYVDTYFDLNRPLYKCDCCSIKLEVHELVKHRRLAHRHKDNTFLKYKLPIIEYLQRNRLKAKSVPSKVAATVDLVSDVSDMEDGEILSKEPKSKVQAVQCEPEPQSAESAESAEPSDECGEQHSKWDVADKCVGEHCETSDKSTNTTTDVKQSQDGCTQTPSASSKSRLRPGLPAMKIGVECDEDGFLELILF